MSAMSDNLKIVVFAIALLFNFTFLATAQTNRAQQVPDIPGCNPWFGKDSMKTRANMGYMQNYYHADNYNEAYVHWTYLYRHAPCSYKSIYQIGQKVIVKLIDDPVNSKRRQGLIDTLMMVFPARIRYFGEEGFVKGSWAFNMGRYQPSKSLEILQLYSAYVSERRDSLNEQYVRDYMRNAVLAKRKALLESSGLVSLYSSLTDLAERAQTRAKADSSAYREWTYAISFMDRVMAQELSCEDMANIFQPKLKANPGDVALMRRAIQLYQMMGRCQDDQRYIALMEDVFILEPDPDMAEILGMYFELKKNKARSLGYYLKAIELNTEDSRKVELYYHMAVMQVYTSSDSSRMYAEKALALNPKHGRSMIISGLAIFNARCGDTFQQAAAACAAVDLFSKAGAVDESCAQSAREYIASYSQYFPYKQDAAARSLKEGDPYVIPCSGIRTILRLR